MAIFMILILTECVCACVYGVCVRVWCVVCECVGHGAMRDGVCVSMTLFK